MVSRTARTGVQVTVLVDDRLDREGLITEHGLALWIEVDGLRILFDTGQTSTFVENADSLGIPLTKATAVVLSHRHYDHTGGLDEALSRVEAPRLFLHPDALLPCFARTERANSRSVGMPPRSESALRDRLPEVTWAIGPTPLGEHVWLTGPIPRLLDFENGPSGFYRDPECIVPDPVVEDQALWITTGDGPVVVLGCAHAGVCNTLAYVTALSGCARIRALIGGLHLSRAGQDRLRATAKALSSHRLELLAPCHCTGDDAARFLGEALTSRIVNCASGTRFTF